MINIIYEEIFIAREFCEGEWWGHNYKPGGVVLPLASLKAFSALKAYKLEATGITTVVARKGF